MNTNSPSLYKKTTIEEIRENMQIFTAKYFDGILTELSENLLRVVQKNRRLNFFKGSVQSWAAAIIYTLARFNFLFDKDAPNHITPDMICNHFSEDAIKLIKRADQIEQACDFELGNPVISLKTTMSMFELFTTSSGFIIPKFSLESSAENIEKINPAEAKWVKKKFERKIKSVKADLTAKLKQAALKKNPPVKNQLELFG